MLVTSGHFDDLDSGDLRFAIKDLLEPSCKDRGMAPCFRKKLGLYLIKAHFVEKWHKFVSFIKVLCAECPSRRRCGFFAVNRLVIASLARQLFYSKAENRDAL